MSVEITPSAGKLKLSLKKEIEGVSALTLTTLTLRTWYLARRYGAKHKQTGTMLRKIDFKINRRRLESYVYIDPNGTAVKWRGRQVSYAVFVHFGTRPHTIKPRRKKALRFSLRNKWVFAKQVKHPGYQGDPFLYRAAAKALNQLK